MYNRDAYPHRSYAEHVIAEHLGTEFSDAAANVDAYYPDLGSNGTWVPVRRATIADPDELRIAFRDGVTVIGVRGRGQGSPLRQFPIETLFPPAQPTPIPERLPTMDVLTIPEQQLLADALTMKAMLTLPMQNQDTPGERAARISAVRSIAEKAGLTVTDDPEERWLGFTITATQPALVTLTHPDGCPRCEMALVNAESHARVTGSVSATYTYDDTATDGTEHSATWRRLPTEGS
jgi:hypothetical protein